MQIKSYNIAVLDDEEEQCEAVVRLFNEYSSTHDNIIFQIDTYNNAFEFEAVIETNSYDLYVLDIFLQGMTGIDIAKMIEAAKAVSSSATITADDIKFVEIEVKVNDTVIDKVSDATPLTFKFKLAQAVEQGKTVKLFHYQDGKVDPVDCTLNPTDRQTVTFSTSDFSPFGFAIVNASSGNSSAPTGYTVTWDIDGNTSTEPYIENSPISYKGKTPTKAEDANYTYVFKGWDKPFTTAHSDMTYTAVFEAIPKNPQVTTAVSETEAVTSSTTTTTTTVTTEPVGALGAAKNIKVGADRKTVSWDAADNATSYKVEKIIGNDRYYSGVITGTSYTFKNATNSAFKVKVVAINANEKKWSSAKSVAARKLGTVINPKVAADGTVTWDKVYGAVSYNVGKIIGNKTYYIKDVTTNTAKFKNVPKKEYKVFIEAVDKNGNKTICVQAKFGNTVAKATNVVIGEDGKTVTWTAADGAAKYQVVKVVNGTRYYTAKTANTTASFSNAVKEGTYVYVITFNSNNKTSYSDAVTIN